MSHPFLALKDIELNPELAARVPAYLAYYHQAIPVAEEDNQITLWMVYPDNPKAVTLFGELLGQSIFAVRGSQHEIQQALDLLYDNPSPAAIKKFLNWSQHDYLAQLATVFQAGVLDASHASFDTLIKVIQRRPQSFSLVGVDMATSGQVKSLLRQSPTSLYLMHGRYPVPNNILVALQGHSPDLQAIQIALQIATFHHAELTLLGIAGPMKRHQMRGIATLLDTETKAGQHIQKCMELVDDSEVEAFLKLREGLLQEQIPQEFLSNAYDLMVIPVETYGEFVFQVVEQLHATSPEPLNPIWAVKPSR